MYKTTAVPCPPKSPYYLDDSQSLAFTRIEDGVPSASLQEQLSRRFLTWDDIQIQLDMYTLNKTDSIPTKLRKIAFKKQFPVTRLSFCMNPNISGHMNAIVAFLESNPSITTLSLSHCNLPSEDVTCLLSGLYRTGITSLILSGNEIRLSSIKANSSSIARGAEQLKVLHFREVSWRENPNDYRFFKFIQDLLASAPSLETLLLDGCALNDSELEHIASAINDHSSLRTLSLNRCDLTDESVSFIFQIICSNVAELQVSECALTKEGMMTLLDAIYLQGVRDKTIFMENMIQPAPPASQGGRPSFLPFDLQGFLDLELPLVNMESLLTERGWRIIR